MTSSQNQGGPKSQDNLQNFRTTTMGQIRYGDIREDALPSHPFIKFLIKSSFMINTVGVALGWLIFNVLDMLDPAEKEFWWPVVWFFFFGLIYATFCLCMFNFAKFIEANAIKHALTHNRGYEWHTQYDTKNISEAEMNKVPEAQKKISGAQAVRAGETYFRICIFLALSSFATFILGVYTFLKVVG